MQYGVKTSENRNSYYPRRRGIFEREGGKPRNKQTKIVIIEIKNSVD